MQSEEFNNKIKEAADHHHPAYDENAWAGMEKLLDVHLPQKKDDRRRFIFFLLLFLLAGSGAITIFFVSKNKNEQRSASTVNTPATEQPGNARPTSSQQETASTNEDNSTTNTVAINDNNNTSGRNVNTIFQNPTSANVQFQTNSAIIGKKHKSGEVADDVNKKQKAETSTDKLKESSPAIPDLKNNTYDHDIFGLTKPFENISGNTSKPANSKDVIVNNQELGKKNETVTSQLSSTEEKTTTPAEVVAKENKSKPKNKKNNSFSFTFSAGPDVSVAGSDKPGRMKLLAGLGFQYTIKDRFSIRTGFYTSHKVYSASADQYHAPAIFYTYYPYLEKVDADCKVYEIPLSVTYNFGRSGKKNWFASAGLSSYLMKNETYNYYYKTTPAGATRNQKFTLLDANKHYFSVMTISGGYKRSISKSLSLTVEPYVKLPLSGIGYGKVNLNSTGVMFTIGISPFNSTKK